MTSVTCPYCNGQFRISKPKSGRFKLTCSKCSKTFMLAMKVEGDKVRSKVARIEDLPKKKPTKSADQTRLDQQPETSEVPKPPKKSPTRASLPDQTRQESHPDSVEAGSSIGDDDFVEASIGSNGDVPFANSSPPVPDRLGGYKIIKELGRGGLGVVYLAQQVSLDRQVALKTILAKIAGNSAAVSRFMREAYAAAQLTHQNVVQVYDLGRDGSTNFFSMEYVPGVNLSQLVKREGPQDPERAARLILQAARGLYFAHRQGMVHRDIKPANLMLSDLGVVKVADLGLVKVGDENETKERGFDELARMSAAELTMAGFTLGTANYMAPEQAEDSATVDHRADIYALGCSLYVLLTGRPPFKGKSAIDVISKHRTQPVVRPELLVDRVDDRLSDIVIKMVAKNPGDRHAHLGEVIDELENYLGISTANVLNPEKKHVTSLQQSQQEYYGLPLAKVRKFAPVTFVGLCLIGLLILSFVSWRWASGIISFAVVAPIAYALIRGFLDGGVLFERLRNIAFKSGVRRWIQAAFVGLLVLVILVVAKLFTIWAVFAVFAITAAALYCFAVDRQVSVARAELVKPVQEYLNHQRVAGVDEHSLQRFVAKYSGKDWEEYFEDLFGYDALRLARIELASGELGGKRKRTRPIRDFIVDHIDGIIAGEKKQSDQENLQSIEKDALIEGGVAPEVAEAQAAEFANALVQVAAEWRANASHNIGAVAAKSSVDPAIQARQKRERVKAMLADSRSGKYRKKKSVLQRLHGPLDLILGSHVRFAIGTLLIVGCAFWVRQNGIFDSVSVEALKDVASTTIQQGNADVADVVTKVGIDTSETKPLRFPIVGDWFTGFGPGVAGLLLVFSAFFRGWKMSLFMIPAAVVAWHGPAIGIPGFGKLCPAEFTSIGIAIAIASVGFLFGRQKNL